MQDNLSHYFHPELPQRPRPRCEQMQIRCWIQINGDTSVCLYWVDLLRVILFLPLESCWQQRAVPISFRPTVFVSLLQNLSVLPFSGYLAAPRGSDFLYSPGLLHTADCGAPGSPLKLQPQHNIDWPCSVITMGSHNPFITLYEILKTQDPGVEVSTVESVLDGSTLSVTVVKLPLCKLLWNVRLLYSDELVSFLVFLFAR